MRCISMLSGILILAALTSAQDNVCVNNGDVDDACDSGESEEQTCKGKDKEYCQIMCTNCTACSTHDDETECDNASCLWTSTSCSDECVSMTSEVCGDTDGCSWTNFTCTDQCSELNSTDCTTSSVCVWDMTCEVKKTCDQEIEIAACNAIEGCTYIDTVCTDICSANIESVCDTDSTCVWENGACTHTCQSHTSEADCDGDDLCQTEDVTCRTTGSCDGNTSDTCKSGDGCLWGEGFCSNDGICDNDDQETCDGQSGCSWTGGCDYKDGGSCTDHSDEDTCCANQCSWVECTDSGVSHAAIHRVMICLSLISYFL